MKKYIILFILLAIFIVIQADECTFEKLQVTTATKVEECLIKIPFIENVRTKTIEHLKKIYQFYVYRDISLNSYEIFLKCYSHFLQNGIRLTI